MGTRDQWFVYLVRCVDASFYVGISQDVERRVQQHNLARSIASRYCWSRRPVRIHAWWQVADRSSALQLELYLKRLSHVRKARLCGRGEYWDVRPDDLAVAS